MEKINDVLTKFSLDIKGSGYKIIEKIAFINTDIFDVQPVKLMCDSNIKVIINLFIVGIVIFFALKNVMRLYSDISLHSIYYNILRFIIVAILSLNSYSICRYAIHINSLFSELAKSYLEEVSGQKIEYNFLDENIYDLDEYIKGIDKVGINGVEDSVISIYIITLMIFLSIRYVVLLFCIIISPFVFIFLMVDRVSKYFYIWFKVFIINLVVEILNIFIIFIPIVSKNEKDIYLSILIGSVFLLYKLNKEVGEIRILGKNK